MADRWEAVLQLAARQWKAAASLEGKPSIGRVCASLPEMRNFQAPSITGPRTYECAAGCDTGAAAGAGGLTSRCSGPRGITIQATM